MSPLVSVNYWFATSLFVSALLLTPMTSVAEFRVGAAVVDVTPTQMPVLVNGGVRSRTATEIKTRVNARSLVLSDGKEQIAMVVVDSCMMPRSLLDDAKKRAEQETGIRADRIMISATHTHTAPSSFGALGTAADTNYVPLLRERIVESIAKAQENLAPAKYGWGSRDVPEMTALRRWVRRPDRIDLDPFGNPTVRANMHAARDHDLVTGPSGPEDPQLSIIAFQKIDGTPIAILANYSMHYFGDQPISADYFGLFSDAIAKHAATTYAEDSGDSEKLEVVGVLSHGCSGDIWRRDYWTYNGKDDSTIDSYAQSLAAIAAEIYDEIEYRSDADLAMTQTDLPMRYRVPDAQRLQWAQAIVENIQDDLPKDRLEVYAREQVLLHQMQSTNILVQAIRIGELAIATTPNETYALTGLKLKLQSPVDKTMVIELANGADGYIPPPEQHHLGGYNTWAARSAGLEEMAEPRIVAAGLAALEKVTQNTRRHFVQSAGERAKQVLSSDPGIYLRMDQMEDGPCTDSSGNHRDGTIESGVLFFLDGPDGGWTAGEPNRCMHFAGGRIHEKVTDKPDQWTAIVSIWNGMPVEARETAGWFLSLDHNHSITPAGIHLGISGTAGEPGKLVLQQGIEKTSLGRSELKRWQWYRVAIVCDQENLSVYLEGASEPEIRVRRTDVERAAAIESLFIGGRSDSQSNWEGRLDEVAVFGRALNREMITSLLDMKESSVAPLSMNAPQPVWIKTLEPLISEIESASNELSADRTMLLEGAGASIAKAIVSRENSESTIGLNFICTHNSRRSHLSEIWAAVAAQHYSLPMIRCYSGGTEATACNERIVQSLQRGGFNVDSDSPFQSNPQYRIRFAENVPPLLAFSKRFDDGANPSDSFFAMMCCSDADEKCPLVPGAIGRVALHYQDPKSSDGTPSESATYDERRNEIGAEMFFLLREVAKQLSQNTQSTK